MSDLDRLIAAVEGGVATMNDFAAVFPSETAYGKTTWGTAHNAFSGSLDAALRLHEALLPGWAWTIDAGDGATVENRGDFGIMYSADASVGSPSRTWLLAILRAVKAQEGKA